MTKELILKLKKITRKVQVLYAEDDPHIAAEVEKMLKRIFFNIDIVTNGKEGLELYKKVKHDIVITDIAMPEMDGIAMTKEIKKLNEDQVVIVTSAYNDANYLTTMIEAGVDKFIMKPIDMKQFFMTISKIVINLYNERKKEKLEEQLFEELQIKNVLLEKLFAPVVILDNGKIRYANPKFTEYFNLNQNPETLNNLQLNTIFKDQEFTGIDNLSICSILEKNNGSVRTLIVDAKGHTQRYSINVTSIQKTQKTLLFFFNVEELHLELDKLKHIYQHASLEGLLTRNTFIKNIHEIIEYDKKTSYEVICFGLKHMDKYVQRFGAVSLHDIYKTISEKLQNTFNEPLQNDVVKIFYFGSNHYVALVKKEEAIKFKEYIKEFAQHNNYTQLFTSEPITLDYISIELDKTMPINKILADVENKLYMLLK